MTNNQVNFKAQKRTVLGKKTKQLRAVGIIPANISGDLDQPVAISVEKTPFTRLHNEVGETSLIYLEVDGIKHPVLIDEITLDPITDEYKHITFKQVNLKETVSADVAIHVVGEPANKQGNLIQVLDVVAVIALPSDLPESLEVDASVLTEVGQQISINDIVLPKNVEFDLDEEQRSEPVVILQEQAVEEVVEDEGEVEVEASPTATEVKAESEKSED